MTTRWPCLIVTVLCSLLVSCATQPPPTPKQVKVETDFNDCVRDLGARGPALTSVSPDGAFKWRPGTGGEVSIAQEKTMMACMRGKDYRFNDGPTPR